MPEFYVIIARKIFFPNFRGAGARAPLPPGSYAYGSIRVYSYTDSVSEINKYT